MVAFAELDKNTKGSVNGSSKAKPEETPKEKEGFFQKIKRAIFD